jgi:hypothetical protein
MRQSFMQYLTGHRHISSTEAYRINEMEGLTEEVTTSVLWTNKAFVNRPKL